MAEKTDEVKKEQVKVSTNFFVYVVIGLIILTFVISSGVLPGFKDFVAELTKTVEYNEDGTRSIQRLAQTPENQGNPDTYIGKVLGKKIQFGRDDDFNRKYDSIVNNRNFNGYQKYQYIRMIFEDEIEKIIGMRASEKTGISVSNGNVLKVIAKRDYTDQSGKVNYDALKRDLSKINQGRSEEIRSELLFEHYDYDYFANLPVSYDEVEKLYIEENQTVKVSYVNIGYDDIPMDKLDQYLKVNDEKFKMFKISKMIFSESAKKEAEAALISVIASPDKFNETAAALKAENKLINVLNNTEYYFAEDFDTQISELLPLTKTGDVVNKIVKEENIGYVVIKLEDVKSASLSEESVLTKVKAKYAVDNKAAVEQDTLKKAQELYAALKEGVSLSKAASDKGLKAETPETAYKITDRLFTFFAPDNDNESAYTASLFAKNKGDVIEPFTYANGVLVAVITDKTEADTTAVSSSYEQLEKKIASAKTGNLKYDYYTAKKKEYKVVDNFNYVFNIQDFLK